MRQIICDICKQVKDVNDITASFQYVKWSMFGKKSSTPVGIQEDYCKDCQGKILEAVEKVKKEVS